MTINQLAAYLDSLFNDETIFKGWMDEYDADSTTNVEGEINFKGLALKLVEDGHIKLDPDPSTP